MNQITPKVTTACILLNNRILIFHWEIECMYMTSYQALRPLQTAISFISGWVRNHKCFYIIFFLIIINFHLCKPYCIREWREKKYQTEFARVNSKLNNSSHNFLIDDWIFLAFLTSYFHSCVSCEVNKKQVLWFVADSIMYFFKHRERIITLYISLYSLSIVWLWLLEREGESKKEKEIIHIYSYLWII